MARRDALELELDDRNLAVGLRFVVCEAGHQFLLRGPDAIAFGPSSVAARASNVSPGSSTVTVGLTTRL
jgi:hypothetical protein